jgi:hypothetical protein
MIFEYESKIGYLAIKNGQGMVKKPKVQLKHILENIVKTKKPAGAG